MLTKDEGQAGAVACAVSEAVKGLAALFDAVQIVGDDELLVALGHGAHDRVAEKALLERRGEHGHRAAVISGGRRDAPVAVLVPHAADVELRVKIVHEQFRALTQGLGRRHKLVTDHEKLVGDAEERIRVSLHGSRLSEQGQQAAPAVQGNAACVRDIALIKSPLGRRQEIDDSPAVFRCGTDEQLHDAFFDGFFGFEHGRKDSCSGWASGN